MKTHKEIDILIQNGADLIQTRETQTGCDVWLEAWEGIKALIRKTGAIDLTELQKKYPFEDYLTNYAQDLEMELHNAGIDDPSYHEKRIAYCTELLECCGGDQNITENTRRAIAESYADLGDMQTCDRLFEGWLQEDPNWGWGYNGWSDCHWFYLSGPCEYQKGEQILQRGLAQPELRDRIDVVSRLIELYERMQEPEKAREYKVILQKLMPSASEQSLYYKPSPIIKPAKTGRNEPCRCGSGKKYKKCCGVKMVV